VRDASVVIPVRAHAVGVGVKQLKPTMASVQSNLRAGQSDRVDFAEDSQLSHAYRLGKPIRPEARSLIDNEVFVDMLCRPPSKPKLPQL
jgi:hypothetical protein